MLRAVALASGEQVAPISFRLDRCAQPRHIMLKKKRIKPVRAFISLIMLSGLAACSGVAIFDGETVSVDDIEFFVAPADVYPGAYIAGPNDFASGRAYILLKDIGALNLKAIEAYTGCPVSEVIHPLIYDGTSVARVACPG